jgi:hypothetical protein
VELTKNGTQEFGGKRDLVVNDYPNGDHQSCRGCTTSFGRKERGEYNDPNNICERYAKVAATLTAAYENGVDENLIAKWRAIAIRRFEARNRRGIQTSERVQ